jgi:hypothetical protein
MASERGISSKRKDGLTSTRWRRLKLTDAKCAAASFRRTTSAGPITSARPAIGPRCSGYSAASRLERYGSNTQSAEDTRLQSKQNLPNAPANLSNQADAKGDLFGPMGLRWNLKSRP